MGVIYPCRTNREKGKYRFMSPKDRSPEEQLVDYALALDLDRLDSRVHEYLCHLILDQIAIGVGAISRNLTSGSICEAYVLENGGGNAVATLWSGKGCVSTPAAALVNGTWAEILDFQDVVVDPRITFDSVESV